MVPTRPMSGEEMALARALARCHLRTPQERSFADGMAKKAGEVLAVITTGQANWLRKLRTKYQRELPCQLVPVVQGGGRRPWLGG
jgi:hypothetical protein